ncbi:unnamed protein product [Urochloa humidicola]
MAHHGARDGIGAQGARVAGIADGAHPRRLAVAALPSQDYWAGVVRNIRGILYIGLVRENVGCTWADERAPACPARNMTRRTKQTSRSMGDRVLNQKEHQKAWGG